MFHILLAKYKETSGNARLLHTTVYISFSVFFCRFICFVGKYFWCGCTAWWAASCLSSLWVYCWVYKTWHFGSFFSCATTSRKAGLRNNRCWKKIKKRSHNIILLKQRSVKKTQCPEHTHPGQTGISAPSHRWLLSFLLLYIRKCIIYNLF